MSEDSERLQNDPDRAAGNLVPDAHGEFVTSAPGGAFDPRSFRDGDDRPARGGAGPAARDADPPARPPVDDERMSGPGEEIDKTR
ncbi:MAG TPA: hypothetical protein VF657_01360 [Actinoplanes sp.]|jgi:hypothetical protein